MSICSNASWKALIIPARSCPGSPEKAGVGGSIPSLATIEITHSFSGNNLQLPKVANDPDILETGCFHLPCDGYPSLRCTAYWAIHPTHTDELLLAGDGSPSSLPLVPRF
jgi:hypothetical protein